MFSIQKNKKGKHQLWFKEEMIAKLFLEDGQFQASDGWNIEIEKIADVNASDFPDNLELSINSTEKIYCHCFKMFNLARSGNEFTIEMHTILDGSMSNFDLEWLTWNPWKFADLVNDIASSRGHISFGEEYNDENIHYEEGEVLFIFKFKINGTIGDVFNRAFAEAESIFRAADESLYNEAKMKFG